MSIERVRYFPPNDLAHGMGLEKIAVIEIPEFDGLDINDAIEYYQIYLYFKNGTRLKTWTDEEFREYSKKAHILRNLTMRFFSSLNNETIFQEYEKTEIGYAHVFWDLFNHCKLFERISSDTFDLIIHSEKIFPFDFFKHKAIVHQYGSTLKNYLLEKTSCVGIIIDAYEQDYRDGEKLYLPSELMGGDICQCFRNYIETPDANPNMLESISQIAYCNTFPIPPELRFKAKKRYDERIKELLKDGIKISHKVSVSICPNQDEIKKTEMSENKIRLLYSENYLLQTLEYSEIINNCAFLFEFFDYPQIRCNLVSNPNKMGIFEKGFSKELKCYYPRSYFFDFINRMARMQMAAYYFFLKNSDIRFEDVLHWFFTEHLQSEYGCPEIRLLFPSEGTTYAEKCSTICTTLDSIVKQFSLYVENNEIDFGLISFASSPIPFSQIPSLNEKKYIYGTGKDFENLSSILFSDQCLYSFVPRIYEQKRHYESFYELLKNEDVFLTDYRESEYATFRYLEKNEIISISPEGKLSLNNPFKIAILKDLYNNGVISKYHCPKAFEVVFQEWIADGILLEEDSLLSKQESDYFNYLLNRSEYSNGLDIRNKYIHGVQQVEIDENEHRNNYFILLIVFTILAIKIDDDFRLKKMQQ